ncbi:flagellar basal body rod protein FlgB [Legionella dresdenensis]|uniref:Flagellar basal body rod protein FlgB n=1 Tax=Legionella dresdenensis TaxID=450200 RepID=A0ABV8CBS5_9GAMM
MAVNLDSYFGIHAKALIIRDQRASQLANNIANADTPNYKAQDVEFKEALREVVTGPTERLVTTDPDHIRISAPMTVPLKFRVPQQVSLDGNTVDKDVETTQYVDNSLAYQATLSFLNSKILQMRSAIKGE